MAYGTVNVPGVSRADLDKVKKIAEQARTAANSAFGERGDLPPDADEATTPGIYAGSDRSCKGLPTEGCMGTLVIFSTASSREWTVQLFFAWDEQSFYWRIFDPVHATKGSWTKIG